MSTTMLGIVLGVGLLILALQVGILAVLAAQLRALRENGRAIRARVRNIAGKLEEMDEEIAAWFETLNTGAASSHQDARVDQHRLNRPEAQQSNSQRLCEDKVAVNSVRSVVSPPVSDQTPATAARP